MLSFQSIRALKHMDKVGVFSTTKLSELASLIRSMPSVTAVFINIEMLTTIQLATLQRQFKVPVYDR